MRTRADHPHSDAICEGGDLDCGGGLLLLIRKAMASLDLGQVLEIRSREISVREDLPAWCRMSGHAFLGESPISGRVDVAYFVRKGGREGSHESELQSDLERARDYEWLARVRLQSPLTARVYARNHTFDVGQPASFAAADPALSAVEYLLGAFGASLVVFLQTLRGARLWCLTHCWGTGARPAPPGVMNAAPTCTRSFSKTA